MTLPTFASSVPSRRVRRSGVIPTTMALITAMCWGYLFLLTMRMGDMRSPLSMPMTSSWTRSDVVLMWTMWAVMMAGMMLPSAVPMVRTYSTSITSKQSTLDGSTPLFTVGYIIMWSGFGLAATGAQWLLHDSALISPMGVSNSRWLGGLLLVGAGAYQFTDAKGACLDKCRTPLGFLLSNWRGGYRGALVMGLHHGSLCIGCCWALMAVLFVLGVMNLWWIALVSAVVLVEKFIPGDQFTRLLGVGLVVWGTVMIALAI